MAEPSDAERKAEEEKLASLAAELPQGVFGATDFSKRTDEEKSKVVAALQALEEAKCSLMPSKGGMIQFLMVADWNVDDAVRNYQKMVQWREEKKIDTLLSAWHGSEDERLFHMLFPARVVGFDREGLPVVIDKTGKTHPGAVATLDEERFLHMHTCANEETEAKLKEARARSGRDIVTFTQVLDLAGLTLSHASVLSFLQKVVSFDKEYYPERMERVLIVNAPWVVPGLWEMIKLFLDQSTQSKIVMLGWNYKEELKQYVDADQLPEEYGGTGPNIPTASSEEIADYLRKDADGLSLKQQYIYASSRFDKTVEVPAGHQIVWSFEVVDQYDVDFSVVGTPKAGGADVALKPKSRSVAHKGAYTATEDMSVKIVWDNSFSWVNGKYVNWHVSVKAAE